MGSDIDVDDDFDCLGHGTPLSDRITLAKLAISVKPKLIIEVGCYVGMSTIALAKACPNAKIAVVDHFRGNHDDALGSKDPDLVRATFARNMGERLDRTVFIYEGLSEFWSEHWPLCRAELIHLDAAHDYHSVARDINGWKKHLVHGGILCGHDFNLSCPGVVQAVLDFGFDDFEGRMWWRRHGLSGNQRRSGGPEGVRQNAQEGDVPQLRGDVRAPNGT